MSLPLPDPLPRRINVGCGFDIRPGFLNVDGQGFHNPDIVADFTDLSFLPEGHFDYLLAQDVLEHIERDKVPPTLAGWARLLSPGGTIRLRVPSLMHLFDMLAQPQNQTAEAARSIMHLIFGTQAYKGDYHLAGFTPVLLHQFLLDAGLMLSRASILDNWLFEVEAKKTQKLVDPEDQIHHVYFDVLERPVDIGALGILPERLAAGLTYEQLKLEITGSDEYRFLKKYPRHLGPYRALMAQPNS